MCYANQQMEYVIHFCNVGSFEDMTAAYDCVSYSLNNLKLYTYVHTYLWAQENAHSCIMFTNKSNT
jgi:hypothetical protein